METTIEGLGLLSTAKKACYINFSTVTPTFLMRDLEGHECCCCKRDHKQEENRRSEIITSSHMCGELCLHHCLRYLWSTRSSAR